MSRIFDPTQIRRAFSRASATYAATAALQREIGEQLMESLEYLDDRVPGVVLDVGSGPAHAALAMRQRWPKSRIVAVDLALPMLQQAKVRSGWRDRLGLQKPIERVCADLRALPFADNSVDVLFSNLCLQWVEDLPAAFAGFRRVLKPDGLLLVSTFGPQTLIELRESFGVADAQPHVSPFASIAEFGDALMRAGFRNPVVDRDVAVHWHPDMAALMREQRAIGATNALSARRRALTGRARFKAAAGHYEQFRTERGLPASWEWITAMAWSPKHGAPIREGDEELARFDASAIPVRRRSTD
ncbi:malonyl-ACP O-methyltransferase BioC [Luteimonas terrae]|uniref:Malonyl-[acyl-carrier protein] O-methyltransferase n=1 Tax=Luteimonas terrae TaxID=1530191 RepID=A0A4R5U8P1_9GAMM|nr:malonyl-ACP O-methyltransferase BioC [Luteimonas terrae]TDK30861.1 malonyl-[acyl-carrier protein] O-methyltransferase BioC [Luteimonas terrae]